MAVVSFVVLLPFVATAAGVVPMTTFDGASATTQSWREVNDPVMGGQSTGTFKVDAAKGIGVFDGEVKIVPSLKAPGFCNMQAERAHFADVSGADALELVVRSTVAYKGFKAAFGPAPRTGYFSSYKADFDVVVSKEWQTVTIPFKKFSSKWSGTTGEPTVTCSADPSVCPDAEHLKKLTSMEIAAEGAAGKYHLEVKSISAVKMSQGMARTFFASGEVPMSTFDGASATTQQWREVNDPVMGGQSTGTFKVDAAKGVGVFDGEVKIVPSLKAPGFCNMQAERAHFADVSGADALELVVRSTVAYKGFKASFGPAPRTGYFSSYKADFDVAVSAEWQTVTIPFNKFSSKWSDTTGEPTVTCSADPSVCPDAEHLKKLTSMEIAAEGVAGKFHLEVKSISAVKLAEKVGQPMDHEQQAMILV
jgi:hypothetical protein